MADTIGAVIAILLCLFLFSPILLVFYMLFNSKIDVNGDGKNDI
jgi:ABC-type spermidine/putrescine transport system permease subunit II